MMRASLIALVLAVSAVGPLSAQTDSGAYLAGRQAQRLNDFEPTTEYLARAVRRDPQNVELLESLSGAYISLGDVDRAESVVARVIQSGGESQIANLSLLAAEVKAGNWDGILEDFEAGLSVGPLFDGLARAWTLIGAEKVDEALAAFDEVAGQQGVEAFGLYHKALALASLGRFAEADDLLSSDTSLQLTRRGTVAHVQILSQLGRFADARGVLAEAFPGGMDPILDSLADDLDAEIVQDFTIAPDARAGVAELAFDIANILIGEAAPNFTLLYARIVEYLRPDHIEGTLLSASVLETLGQFDLAIDAYRRIPRDSQAFDAAELGRAEAMRKAGREDAAIEVMQQLARSEPDLPVINITLGDALRQMDRFAEAREAYDKAVAGFEEDEPGQWVVYFARAITAERLDDWPAAEADFRKALELQEDQPQVLNYLGYSMLERRENLDEAVAMIERAVAARPESGPIVDSLGWGLYRLGRVDEAVEPMEKAVELMPVDPVVNDHLGDVYWSVGRKLEARFQWRRALSFAENDQNDEVDPDRIRRKLDVGLDLVLENEGEGEAGSEIADER